MFKLAKKWEFFASIPPSLASFYYYMLKRWKLGKLWLKIHTEKWEAGFHICFTLYIVANAEKKNFSKKWRAEWFFASALKWAEMAADHKKGWNFKIFSSSGHGHHVHCKYLKPKCNWSAVDRCNICNFQLFQPKNCNASNYLVAI